MGEDGATHHGVFDIAFLRCLPNLIIYAPSNVIDLRNILYTAQLGLDHPIAIRYPRGRGTIIEWKQPFSAIEIGKGIQRIKGDTIAILTIGTIINNALEAIKTSAYSEKIALYDMQFIKPLDENILHTIFKKYQTIITVEDGTIKGGFGSAIAEFTVKHNYSNNIEVLGIPDVFIEHGTVIELQEQVNISSEKIKQAFEKYV